MWIDLRSAFGWKVFGAYEVLLLATKVTKSCKTSGRELVRVRSVVSINEAGGQCLTSETKKRHAGSSECYVELNRYLRCGCIAEFFDEIH